MKQNTREQKPQRTAAPIGHTGLSGVALDYPVEVPDYPVAPESASVLKFPKAKLDQIFTKLRQNLHRPSWHYSKAIPKRIIEKNQGDSGSFRSREVGDIWARKGKT
jgi:hypothetical protein